MNGLDWSSYMWLFLYSELDHFQHCKRCYETNFFLLFSIHWFINMRCFPHVLNRNKLRLCHFAPNRGSFIQTKSCSWFPPQKVLHSASTLCSFRIVSFPVGVPWWQWVGVWPSTFPVRNILETWREGFRWLNQKWKRKEWIRPWRYVKCVAVWIFQLLTSFEKLLFKATLPFTRFRAEDRLRFHPPFRQWARVVCCLEVTVSVKWTFFFRRDILLERTETSAEKPGGFAKWYEWKLRQIRTAHNLFVRMFTNSEVVSDKTYSVQQHKRERAAWR